MESNTMQWRIFDVMPEPTVVLDATGATVRSNGGARALLKERGGDPSALDAGTDFSSRFSAAFPAPPGHGQAMADGLGAVLRGDRQEIDFDYAYQADGELHWLAIRIRACDLDGAGGAVVQSRDITARVRTEQSLRDSEELFRVFQGLTSEALVLSERGVILHANSVMCAMYGYPYDEIIGMTPLQLCAPEWKDRVMELVRAGHEHPFESVGLRKDGTTFQTISVGRPVPFRGRMVRGTNIRDITAEKRAEETLRRSVVQEEQLRAQALRLVELSAPLIPLTDEVMVMPLIGAMDAARADRVLETLLEGVARHRARTAIVDITGVTGVDTAVASGLLRVAQAARLLGAQVVLTGIRPEVAQTLVALNADFTGIVTKGTLQGGIVHAMNALRA